MMYHAVQTMAIVSEICTNGLAPAQLCQPLDLPPWMPRRRSCWWLGGARPRRVPASPAPSRAPGQPPRIGQGAAQQEVDLSVRAAQLVRCPPDQSVVHGRLQPEQYLLAPVHLTYPQVDACDINCIA
jgi:hypothetical protein